MELSGEGWEVPKRVKDVVDFHWFKVKPGKVLVLGLLSPAPLWYVGHFHNKRMRRCPGSGCDLCAAGVGTQLRYVLGCVEPVSETVGIMEVGKTVGLQLRDRAASHGSCRGLLVEFSKASSSKRSHTELRFVDVVDPPVWLRFPAPDLKMCLERTWARIDSGDEDQ
jgi:hypothetical protein